MDALVQRLGLTRHCHFLGNRDDVSRLYPACDVTVLPSRFEGTPNVLLESMACGVPVVATDVSDNSYVVPEGRAGYLVQLDDDEEMAERIARVLADNTARRAMGARARAWVEQEFSTARLAAKTAAVYQELLDAKLSRYVGRPQPQPWAVQA
jgi:glycosyltransferase involved in cell wall biosynthesis